MHSVICPLLNLPTDSAAAAKAILRAQEPSAKFVADLMAEQSLVRNAACFRRVAFADSLLGGNTIHQPRMSEANFRDRPRGLQLCCR
jgi:hypothetical protein